MHLVNMCVCAVEHVETTARMLAEAEGECEQHTREGGKKVNGFSSSTSITDFFLCLLMDKHSECIPQELLLLLLLFLGQGTHSNPSAHVPFQPGVRLKGM